MSSMLKTAMLIIAAAPMALFASCPDLSGDYLCRANGQEASTRVVQDTVNGRTTYTVISDAQDLEVIADGQRHRAQINDPSVRNATYIAKCSAAGLEVNTTADVFVNGRNMGRAITDFSMSLRPDGNVRTVTTIRLGGRSFPPVTANCQRI